MVCHGCLAKVVLQEDRETFCPKCDTQLTIKAPAVIFVRSAPREGAKRRGKGKAQIQNLSPGTAKGEP
jgi:hypothetical protein